MYYVLFLPALAVLIVAGYRLFHLRRHDKVLQRFWDVRRSALQLLKEHEDEFDSVRYEEVRSLMAFLDDKIEHYDARKQDLFNLRTADLSKEDIRQAINFITTSKDSEAVGQLYTRTTIAMGAAFYAYTPFTILIPVALLVHLLAFLGMDTAKKVSRTVYLYAGTILRDDRYRGRIGSTL